MTGDVQRFRLIKTGSFSHINEHVLEELRVQFPDYVPEVVDVWSEIIRIWDPVNAVAAVWEYGPEILLGRSGLMECLVRTQYAFRKIRRRLLAQNRELAFTLQTQSLFDASIPGTPHFVYTDHTHLANLARDDTSRQDLLPDSWIELERSIYRHATVNFTMSSHVADSIVQDYGCDPGRVECVFAGPNVAWGPHETVRRDGLEVLFVGVDWVRKGGPVLLEAFRLVQREIPRARLTIVGCEPAIDMPNCEVVGRLPPAEISRYYDRASVFCLPTRREPFGIVFAEAIAHGLPVVATTVGAVPDMIQHGQNGYLAQVDDAATIAAHLTELLKAPRLRESFGEYGRQLAATRYNWPATGVRMARRIRRAMMSH